jgi:hypothetical protein
VGYFIKTKRKTIMKKTLIILTGFIGISTFGISQTISPQSINSSGQTMTQSNGSLTFTVGELVVLTQTDSDGNTLGSGFPTGAVITTASIQEPNASLINVKVYPNPTTDLVTVSIQETKLPQVVLEIVDVNGKIVSVEKYAGMSNKIGISTSLWEKGIYVLNLKNTENQLIGSYKIIKQ